jgi:hypothetical protein
MYFPKIVWSGLILGALFLNACDSKTTSDSTASSPATSPVSSAASSNDDKSGKTNSELAAEIDGVSLKLVPQKEANATHLDLFLQYSDSNNSIPDAKVFAMVQSPDGKEQRLPMKYDAGDKHYTVILPGKAAGQYQVKITAEVKGKPVAGRFSFNR